MKATRGRECQPLQRKGQSLGCLKLSRMEQEMGHKMETSSERPPVLFPMLQGFALQATASHGWGEGELSRVVAGCVLQRESSWSASDPEPGL